MRLGLAVAAIAALQLGAAAQSRRPVLPEGSKPGGTFSPAMVAGDFVYTAGALGRTADGSFSADVAEQVRQTFENLRAVLEAADTDFSRVVRVNVFLTDARHFAAMNEVYRSYFPEAPPTRATVESDLALAGALVEIEMVAARRGVERRVIAPTDLKSPELPYSWGIGAGDTVFVAGVTSRDPETYQPVTGDIGVQTRRVLSNIAAVLRAAELTPADVVESTVFLADARDFAGMNDAYRGFFGDVPPVRATVRTRLMNPVFKVEIQCTAVRGGNRRAVHAEQPRSDLPFSPGIAAADRLYLAGFTGRTADGYARGDVAAQTRRCVERARAVLQADGLSLADVISARVYLTDARHFGTFGEVYHELMPTPRPTRTTIGSPLMNADALVEIQFVAARKQ